MSQKAQTIFAVVAVSLTFGAVQLAFGQDLKNRLISFAGASQEAVQETVNRSGKADRLAPTSASLVTTQTIAIHVDRFPTTSIMVRIPAKQASNSTAPSPTMQIKDGRKAASTVACEPVVSVLAEIAKRLPPGRCVT
jgi:hypothetical protein